MTTPGWGEPRPPDDRPFIDRNKKWLVPTVAVSLTMGLGVLAASVSGDREPSEGELRTRAIIVCEDTVRNALRAPSTADFASATATRQAGNMWSVIGSVDAENGFGAKIRSDFECRAVRSADTWRGRVLSLEGR